MWLGGLLATSLLAAPMDVGCMAVVDPPPPTDEGPASYTLTGPLKEAPPPLKHVPVPQGALETVRIKLERSPCNGSCPSYAVELRGDGTVRYEGWSQTLVGGDHTFRIPPERVACLVEAFRSADFWSLNNDYVAQTTHGSSHKLTLHIGGQSKTVTDYMGLMVGMPEAVTALEDAVDRVAGNRFARGDSETLVSLREEHFDFRSPEAASILARAAKSAPEPFVLGMLAEGTPPTGRISVKWDPRWPLPTGLQLASRAGRASVARALIDAGAMSAQADEKDIALRNAVEAGSPATVAEILKSGANPNVPDKNGAPLIVLAREARLYGGPPQIDVPGVLRLLIAAGADPSKRDRNGSTALHLATGAEVVELLLAAGLDIEARDGQGRTPLLTANDDEASLALIKAGADITVTNDGGTVLEGAIHENFRKTIDELGRRGVKH